MDHTEGNQDEPAFSDGDGSATSICGARDYKTEGASAPEPQDEPELQEGDGSATSICGLREYEVAEPSSED
jgi:hypothetical protein